MSPTHTALHRPQYFKFYANKNNTLVKICVQNLVIILENTKPEPSRKQYTFLNTQRYCETPRQAALCTMTLWLLSRLNTVVNHPHYCSRTRPVVEAGGCKGGAGGGITSRSLAVRSRRRPQYTGRRLRAVWE